MASNIKIATALRNTMLDTITTAVGNGGLLRIYDGTQPAGPGTAVTSQVLLGTLTCATPMAAGSSSGLLTFGTITQDSSADASGLASWFRLLTSGGTAEIDGSVGTSGCDLNLNTATIVVGGPIAVTSLTITAPGG